MQKAILGVFSCKHDLTGNQHGFDQNDGWMEGENFVHSGVCIPLSCNPRLASKEHGQNRGCRERVPRGTSEPQ